MNSASSWCAIVVGRARTGELGRPADRAGPGRASPGLIERAGARISAANRLAVRPAGRPLGRIFTHAAAFVLIKARRSSSGGGGAPQSGAIVTPLVGRDARRLIIFGPSRRVAPMGLASGREGRASRRPIAADRAGETAAVDGTRAPIGPRQQSRLHSSRCSALEHSNAGPAEPGERFHASRADLLARRARGRCARRARGAPRVGPPVSRPTRGARRPRRPF